MVGLSSFLVVALALGLWWWSERTFEAEPSAPQGDGVRPGAAASVLQDLVEAVDEGDADAARDLAPEGDESAADLLAAVVANAEEARVDDFSLRYVDDTGARPEGGGWSAAVDAAWRFDGFDDRPGRSEVAVGFRAEGDDVAITGIGGQGLRTPVWMSGPLEVRRTPTTLVLAGDAAQAGRYARVARRAVPVVRRVKEDWDGRLVVEVPATPAALDAALEAEQGEYAAIAAITATVDGSLSPDSPMHVFVNPEVFGQLGDRAAQVVMSHEATHVATVAATSGVPMWLLEGFADYVALRDTDLPLSTTAGQIAERVRDQGVPDALPGSGEFDSTTTHLGATYEAAWLACVELAEAGGEDALVELYERVQDGEEVATVLPELFGMDEDELVRRWQGRLRNLPS